MILLDVAKTMKAEDKKRDEIMELSKNLISKAEKIKHFLSGDYREEEKAFIPAVKPLSFSPD